MKNWIADRQWLLTLTLLNTIILCFCGLPALLTDPIPQSFVSVSFYSIAYLSQNFLFAFALCVILWPIFRFIESNRIKMILALLPEIFVLLFCFMNAKVFSFWRVHINTDLLHMYFSKGGGSQVFEVSGFMYTWISFSVITFCILGIVAILVSRFSYPFLRLRYWFGSLMIVYVIAQSSFLFLSMQNTMRSLQYSIKIPYFYDLSWMHGLQAMHVAIYPKNALATELKKNLSEDKKLNYPLHPLQYHLPKHPMNVLLIVVDTLRYDMINAVNMPHVFHFAEHANQFLDNISGGDCTRPGIFSLFYGIPATYWRDAIEQQQGSIVIRAFQASHYQLGLFASAPLLSPPFEQTVFLTVKHLQTITPGKTPMERDIKITQQMEQFLNHAAHNQKPFFGFMFYDAPHAYNAIPLHHPFHPIGFLNYFNVSSKTPVTPIFNLYKNAVFADDQLIQNIFHTLKKDHLDKNTIVIITSDHGQEFNEYRNDYWEHASGFSQYQMRTPMIIAWPNRAVKIVHTQTTHFDLAPTLLTRVLGVTNPVSDYSVGNDFFSKKQQKFIIAGNYAYYALITKNMSMQFHDSGFYRFTDLKMKPLSDEALTPSDARQLLREMTAYD
ncbi:MAG: hypothetical protein A3F13_06290 [Gammaproteobacteria bacterium RIFCSPHIGHO2_12_FULL_40_19]|nr:MAG: hypothetical protein A3F13_06290 [Gammaproteobacteria bacterium RIFCSPHIGHO2_12_FULL_40_19]